MKLIKPHWLLPMLSLGLIIHLTACVNAQPTPPIETYALPSPTPIPPTGVSKTRLLMMPATIAPQFSDVALIYRTSETQYLLDPYRQFLTAPSLQISNYLQNRLKNKVKATLLGADHPLAANYTLQININDLYADYRHKTAPVAIVSMEFTLYHAKNSVMRQVGYLTLRESTPVAPNNPNALLQGYQQDLENMLPSLNNFLNKMLCDEVAP